MSLDVPYFPGINQTVFTSNFVYSIKCCHAIGYLQKCNNFFLIINMENGHFFPFSFSLRNLSMSSLMTSFFFLPPYSSITFILNFFHVSSGMSIVVFTTHLSSTDSYISMPPSIHRGGDPCNYVSLS